MTFIDTASSEICITIQICNHQDTKSYHLENFLPLPITYSTYIISIHVGILFPYTNQKARYLGLLDDSRNTVSVMKHSVTLYRRLPLH
jgi:hypothetical protein